MHDERRADLWFAVVLVALSLAVMVESWRMPRLADQGAHPMSVPGLTPGLIALVLAMLGIALLWRSLRARGTLSTAQTSSVCHIGQPRRIDAILAAARFTVAMMTQLKIRPR
jgi:putative tricarboxylic transport membrane protein